MRSELDLQLDQLLTSVVGMGERADGMLGAALGALADPQHASVDQVRETDALVDRAYREVQNGVLTAIALHGPVGHDLRRLTALIHVSLHLERMGDYATNVARTAASSAPHARDPELIDQLVEMGEHAREVGRAGLRAFVQQDLRLANDVTQLDDRVDRLNLAIFHRLVRAAAQDEDRIEWAGRMIQVTRQLERFADHGVDIAEMTTLVVGGEPPPASPANDDVSGGTSDGEAGGSDASDTSG